MVKGNTCNSQPLVFIATIGTTPTVNLMLYHQMCYNIIAAPANFEEEIKDCVMYNWTNNHPEIRLTSTGINNISVSYAVNSASIEIVASTGATPQYILGKATIHVFPSLVNVLQVITPKNNIQNNVLNIRDIEHHPNNIIHTYNRPKNLIYEAKGYENNELWDGCCNVNPFVDNGKSTC